MFGVSPYHVRLLCENPWEGGGGMTPEQVGAMTLDQIFMRLGDKRAFRKQWGKRTAPMQSLELQPDGDGLVKGRAEDGTPIRGRVGGQSYAAQIRARLAAEAAGGNTPEGATGGDTGALTARQARAQKRARRRERRARKGG